MYAELNGMSLTVSFTIYNKEYVYYFHTNSTTDSLSPSHRIYNLVPNRNRFWPLERIGRKIWAVGHGIQRAMSATYSERGYKDLLEGMELAKTTLDVITGIGAAALVIPTIIGSGPGSMIHMFGKGMN